MNNKSIEARLREMKIEPKLKPYFASRVLTALNLNNQFIESIHYQKSFRPVFVFGLTVAASLILIAVFGNQEPTLSQLFEGL